MFKIKVQLAFSSNVHTQAAMQCICYILNSYACVGVFGYHLADALIAHSMECCFGELNKMTWQTKNSIAQYRAKSPDHASGKLCFKSEVTLEQRITNGD